MADEQRLAVALEARVKNFERNLAKAEKAAEKAQRGIGKAAGKAGSQIDGKIGRGAKDAERHLASLGRTGPRHLSALGTGARDAAAGFTALRGAMAGGFAIAGIGAMVNKVREVTSAVAEMNAESKIAGIDPIAFQELAFIAKRSKIPVDALTDAMKELQLRGDEFAVTGKGPAAEAFERLGWSAADVAAKLRDPIAMFDQVIAKTRMFEKAGQIRVFDEVFGGTGGERMVSLLDSGVGSLEDMRAEAHRVSAVLDTETIAKAVELDRRFADIADTISTRMKTALIEAGDATFRIIDGLDEAIARLQTYFDELGNSDVFARINKWFAGQGLLSGDATLLDPELADAARAGAIENQEARIKKLTQGLIAANEVAGLDEAEVGAARIEAARVEAERLTDELMEAHDVLANLRAMPTGAALDLGTITTAPQFGPPIPPEMMDLSAAHEALESRRAHNGVNVAGIEASVAQTVAAVLARYPGAQLSSGYRSPETNRGAKRSQHLHGNAVDIVMPGATAEQWESLTRDMIAAGARGLGRYGNGSAHFDWRDGPRAAWGPNYSKSSLGQTEGWFQNLASEFTAGGGGAGAGAGAGGASATDAKARDEVARAAERQKLAVQGVISDLQFENQLLNQSALQQEIATEQRRAGVEATSTEGQKIAELVTARYQHAEAIDAEKAALDRQKTAAQNATQAQAQINQQLAGAFTGAFSGLIRDLASGKSGVEALQGALTKLADQLLSMALNSLFSNIFGSILGGGIPGLADGGPVVQGFATGGFVSGAGGPRSDSIPAMLSNGEFVVNAEATRRFGPVLDAINNGHVPAFASGGVVGGTGSSPLAGNDGAGSSPITINTEVKVERGASGDAEADQKYAAMIGKQIEGHVRHVAIDEIMRQQRSGGILSRRRK